ncbi:response regulator [Pedobacter polaris]|uniref:Response regulator n=2 Tax=Pedobacter polaris TaxID=2571273 RepID=A0A4U1CX17_9SPHI|nr:response regulator [Pedobacter polaris]
MKKSIFILDDTEDIREVITHILTDENYEVQGFATVEEFKKGILFAQPDLIILDVMLPDGNGIDVCDELKDNRRTQHIPVLMMSANDYYSNAKQRCETEDFINKPFDVNDFIARVNDHLL